MAFKRFIRVIGIDDGFFEPRKSKSAILVGVVFRLDNQVEGVLSENVSVDKLDSTLSIASMISKSKFNEQISFIILDGVNFAGFNIVDLEKLFEELHKPVIIVFRKKPDMKKIKNALKKFSDFEERILLLEKAGKIHRFKKIFFQCFGVDAKTAKHVLKKCTLKSNLPEPIRLAHLIASGVSTGESTHP